MHNIIIVHMAEVVAFIHVVHVCNRKFIDMVSYYMEIAPENSVMKLLLYRKEHVRSKLNKAVSYVKFMVCRSFKFSCRSFIEEEKKKKKMGGWLISVYTTSGVF